MDSRTIISDLSAIYDAAVERLRADIAEYARTRALPAVERRHDGSYCYPELRVRFAGGISTGDRSRAFARLHRAGTYATTVTRPQLFADYLAEQLDLMQSDYAIELDCGPSRQEIPFPYVLDSQ